MLNIDNIPFMVCNTPNPRGRIYPKSVMEKAMAEYQSKIDSMQAYGSAEANPPNASNASHIVTELHWVGEILAGSVIVLDTPTGTVIQDYLRSGGKISMAPVSECKIVGTEHPQITIVTDCTLHGFNLRRPPV